jgi:restriction endonuclease S subunit
MATSSVTNIFELKGTKRLDAEYYQPIYLELERELLKVECKRLKNMAFVTDGIHSSIEYDPNSQIRIISAQSVRDNDFDLSANTRISVEQHQRNLRTSLKIGDIIISSVGTIGNTAVVSADMLPCNADRHVGIVRLRDKKFNAFYVSTFLNSKYGRFQTLRESTGNVQLNLFIEKIEQLLIPEIKNADQIGKMTEQATMLLGDSRNLYLRAENLLLEELGLRDFHAKYELSYTASLLKAFGVHRVDAEYFQPTYDEIANHLSKNFVTEKLKDIVSLLKHGKQPYYVEGGEVPILIQKHLGSQYVNLDALNDQDTPRTDRKFIEKYPEYKVRLGDVLFYSVGAYLGRTNVLLTQIDAVPASFITLIRTKKNICSPMFLAVFLNSKVGQLQSNQRKSASAQQYIYPKDIGGFIIPILPDKTQQEIASLVQQSYEARKKARQLLEEAKKKVENLIEGKA